MTPIVLKVTSSGYKDYQQNSTASYKLYFKYISRYIAHNRKIIVMISHKAEKEVPRA